MWVSLGTNLLKQMATGDPRIFPTIRNSCTDTLSCPTWVATLIFLPADGEPSWLLLLSSVSLLSSDTAQSENLYSCISKVSSQYQVWSENAKQQLSLCGLYFFSTKLLPFKYYEKYFLFRLKSNFCSQVIETFVFLSSTIFLPAGHCFRGWSKIILKIYDVINFLNENLITCCLWNLEKEKGMTIK